MTVHSIGIIMNGVTGRMGANQHLIRSILAIRAQGGVVLPDGDRLLPDPLLVGRDPEKLRNLAATHDIARWSTNLASCLADADYPVYFDAQTTALRAEAVRAALRAGKHVYCEKPLATTTDEALALADLARDLGRKNGVVQDKLFLPGQRKLRRVIASGFLGRILAVRGEFGYWVFEGDWQDPQRPSWNYRSEAGGGIIVDMLCHWRYLLDHTVGSVQAVSCLGATHIPTRIDEMGRPYDATAEDAAYATFEIAGGIVAQINSSWCVRVHRDELFELQIDGTLGSAVAGLHDCWVQSRVQTPRATWNPDLPTSWRFRDDWQRVPDNETFDNGFKVQWEDFLRHVAADTAFPADFYEGAKGIQLAEIGMASWQQRRWLPVPPLART